jgi:hypothetical protein
VYEIGGSLPYAVLKMGAKTYYLKNQPPYFEKPDSLDRKPCVLIKIQ